MDMRYAELIAPLLVQERLERAARRQREIELRRRLQPQRNRRRFWFRQIITDRQDGIQPLPTASS